MDEVPVAALAPLVVLALAWVAWCWWDIAHGQVRHLPKWAWALICVVSVPVEVASREAAEAGLVAALADAGARVVGLEPRDADLERVFLELTR